MSNMESGAGARSVGVGIPMGQLSPGTGQPRSVTGYMEMKNVAIEYVDDAGNKHRTVALLDSSGTWYLPPNGENFAATLKPLAPNTWLAQALSKIQEKLKADAAPVDPKDIPATDSVDIG